MVTGRMAMGAAGTFLGLAGVTCGLTWVYLGMRSVMEIGGACASGGPYVIQNPCPEGIPIVMTGGVVGGLIALGVFLVSVSRFGGGYSTLAFWGWPALFLSLGWNFLEYGLDPQGEEGAVFGWLLCAGIFAVMGGVPLIGLLMPKVLRQTFWPSDSELAHSEEQALRRGQVAQVTSALRPVVRARARTPGPASVRTSTLASSQAPTPAPANAQGDIVERLERLAKLHREGALDAAEYERAKDQLLGGDT